MAVGVHRRVVGKHQTLQLVGDDALSPGQHVGDLSIEGRAFIDLLEIFAELGCGGYGHGLFRYVG
jgi:hypothetical protein